MDAKLQDLIREMAPQLQVPPEVDPAVFLAALAFCESSFGRNTTPRKEAAYLPGGRYSQAAHVRQALQRYGEAAAASYGPWQVLYITALELGFQGKPEELAEPRTNLLYAIKYLNERGAKRGAKTIGQLADCYNSGNHRDKYVPTGYVRKLIRAYNGVARQWLEEDT